MTVSAGVSAKYGAAQPIALTALGRPTAFLDCPSIVLDKGGDDGYWMRIYGNQNFKHHRCGSLVITRDAVAYGELCAGWSKPGSGVSFAVKMAGGKKRAFADYVWTARKDEIDSVQVHHVCLSPHGAYAAVALSAKGETVRFGVHGGRRHPQDCIAALRYLAGEELDLSAPSASAPRTDGIYLLAAHTPESRFQAVYFESAGAALLGLADVHKNLADTRSGAWQIKRSPYHGEDDHYVIEDANPALWRHVWIQDGDLLAFQTTDNRSGSGKLWSVTSELRFVSDDEITEGWGLASIPWPLEAPDWAPVIVQGDLVAPDLGAPKARVKG